MRIVDLTTLYLDGGDGGVNTYLTEKARYLARHRPDVEHAAIVTGRSTRTERIERTRVHFVRSPSLPGNPEHRVLVDFRRLGALLREEKPDLVEVDCTYFLAWAARRALRRQTTAGKRVPIVGLYHVHLPRLYTRAVRNPLRSLMAKSTAPLAWKYSELCARPCDRVVVTSKDLHEQLGDARFPPLDHVALGVNPELFRPSENGQPRAPDGIDPNRPIVLYVGRLSPEKDLDVLLRAHEILRDRTDAQLVVCGEGPMRRVVEKHAAQDDSIVVLGRLPYGTELADLYRASSLLVVPGRNEAFGLVVLETLRDGLGRFARPGDADDFAAKTLEVLETLAAGEDDSAARRHHVMENFSWTRSFERLTGIYESLVPAPLGARG